MKKLLLLPLVLLVLLSSVIASFPIDNLVGYWDFREGSGTTFSNLMGTGENLTLTGDVSVIDNYLKVNSNTGNIRIENSQLLPLISDENSIIIIGNTTTITTSRFFELQTIPANISLSTQLAFSTASGGRFSKFIKNTFSGSTTIGSVINNKNLLVSFSLNDTTSSMDILGFPSTYSFNVDTSNIFDNDGVILSIGNDVNNNQGQTGVLYKQVLIFDKKLTISELNYIYDNQEDDFLLLLGGFSIDNESVSGNIYNDEYFNQELSFVLDYSDNQSNLSVCSLTTDGNVTFTNATINATSCFLNVSPEENINYSWVISDGVDTLQTTFQTLSFDGAPPVTEGLINNSPNSNGWFNSSVTLTLNASDNLSGVNNTLYCLGDECVPDTTYSSPIIVSDEGVTTIRYKSTDNLGNNETIQEEIIKIDTVPPITLETIVGTINNGTYTTSVTIALNPSDIISGVNNTLFCLGNNCSPETLYEEQINLVISGNYIIRFTSTDNAGNKENITELNLTLQVAPIIGGGGVIEPVFVGEGLFRTRVGNDTMIALIILTIVCVIAGYMKQRLGILSLVASLFLLPLGIILYLVTSNLIIGLFVMIVGILLIFQE